jgi:signal transduction histidine kinase
MTKLGLDKIFLADFLNFISEILGLNIFLYLNESKELIYPEKTAPPFCLEALQLSSKSCTCKEPIMEKNIYMCPAGLFCKNFEMLFDGKSLGFMIIGHARLKEKDVSSCNKMNRFLEAYCSSPWQKDIISDKFTTVKYTTDEALNDPRFDTLNIVMRQLIKQYILSKSDRIRDEHEEFRINALKLRAINVAHEFQLPIQAMVAMAENLYLSLNEEKEEAEIAKELLFKLIKLSHIADNLRNLSEPTNQYEFKKIDYVTIIEDTIKLFREQAKKKGVTITNLEFIGQPNYIIEASHAHIEQVIFNVLNNAVKYSTSNKRIRVICRELKNYIAIEIINYGVGIEKDEIEGGLIFNEGYRGRLTKDQSRIGSGLGLWISKKIVDDHGGKIEIESDELRVGEKTDLYKTIVKIHFPLLQKRE